MSPLSDYEFIGQLAYQGKQGCTDARCRRVLIHNEDGTRTVGECLGWHCPYCDEPCSMMGHRCDAQPEALRASRSVSGGGAT